MELVGTGSAVTTENYLQDKDLGLEFMMNAMRLTEGVPKALFEVRTGLSFDFLDPAIYRAQELGLMHKQGDWLRPTKQGRNFLNDLLILFH